MIIQIQMHTNINTYVYMYVEVFIYFTICLLTNASEMFPKRSVQTFSSKKHLKRLNA